MEIPLNQLKLLYFTWIHTERGEEGGKEEDRHGRKERERQGGKDTDTHRYIHTYAKAYIKYREVDTGIQTHIHTHTSKKEEKQK